MTIETVNEFDRLDALQHHVEQLERDRGFDHQTVTQQWLLLGEEVGELFKAVRKTSDLRMDANSTVKPVEGELADILIYVCSIANRLKVNLYTALQAKEEINKQRVWT
jgi:NTP pyrophosphatase (non-canonical NTP hydrolase)